MSRIAYPASWTQPDRDALDHLFEMARENGLWFYHNSLAAGPLWYSPDELDASQKRGTLVWGAPNWRLRNPREHLTELDKAIELANDARNQFIARLPK